MPGKYTGWPPTDRNPREPQVEACDLCSLDVGAVHLAYCDVDGLRGYMICDVNPDCRQFRANIPFQQMLRETPTPYSLGQGRRLPGSSSNGIGEDTE